MAERAETQEREGATDPITLARARIAHAAREHQVLLADLRVRTSRPEPSGFLVLAQANAHADGHPLRAQVIGESLGEAIDALVSRCTAKLAATRHGWSPRSYPDPAENAPIREYDPPTSARVARIKRVPLAICPAQVAAAMMDALDYDAHVFIDAETGQDALIYRAGPTGYRLARLDPATPSRATTLPLVTDPRPAPHLYPVMAAAQANILARPHLLFADPHDGRARLLYRRHDGEYTLLAPADREIRHPPARA